MPTCLSQGDFSCVHCKHPLIMMHVMFKRLQPRADICGQAVHFFFLKLSNSVGGQILMIKLSVCIFKISNNSATS